MPVMKIATLASGSSGNSIYIGTNKRNILIDAGITCKALTENLAAFGLGIGDIDGVFITHEHTDHIGGLGVILRRYELPVYLTEGTYDAIMSKNLLGRVPEEAFNIIKSDSEFNFGDVHVHAIHSSHDAAEPVIYRFDCEDKSAAIVTDIGEPNPSMIETLKGLSVLLLEANHDVCMLQAGPYPYPLKHRILSEKGHLSNETAGQLAVKLCSENMKNIMLSHLSETNNYPELAREAVKMELVMAGIDSVEVDVAPRYGISKVIEI